jgi:phosphotransferase system IIA component
MDQFIQKGVEVLFGYGLPGLIIAYLLYERKIMQDQMSKKDDALNTSQENRIKEARETTNSLNILDNTLEVLKGFMNGGGNNKGGSNNG